MFKKIKTIMGALGWMLLGIVLMRNGIGPWWVGWSMLTVAAITLLLQMGQLVDRKEWQI